MHLAHGFHEYIALHKSKYMRYTEFNEITGSQSGSGDLRWMIHLTVSACALLLPAQCRFDQRHSSSQSQVSQNDAHRTSSPGERYFFGPFAGVSLHFVDLVHREKNFPTHITEPAMLHCSPKNSAIYQSSTIAPCVIRIGVIQV